MASKKYDMQVAQGKSKRVALAVAMFTFLGTIGTLAWVYSRPDSWIFSENALQAGYVVAEMKKALHSLEKELELIRSDSCARPPAGPFGSVKVSTTNPLIVPDEAVNPELAELLRKLTINKEILVVLATKSVHQALNLLVQSLKRVNVRNYLIVALDQETVSFCKQIHAPYYGRVGMFTPVSGLKSQTSVISGLKFLVLRDFLVLGYSVMLSDSDIVYLQNPFEFLYRDSDVEGMTDGHDNRTSYGYIDEWDDPPYLRCRLVHSARLWVFNSGLFYLRPTAPAIALLDRVYARVAADPSLWDQDVFNEELMFPSSPGYKQLHISKRVMDYLLFMNSKTLFSFVRHDLDGKYSRLKPVTVHINYHSRKHERMEGVIEYYVRGNKEALTHFPIGDP